MPDRFHFFRRPLFPSVVVGLRLLHAIFLGGLALFLTNTSPAEEAGLAQQSASPEPFDPPKLVVGPPADWVVPTNPALGVPLPAASSARDNPDSIREGYFFRLVEHQIHIEKQAHYHHFSDELITVAGLHQHSEIGIDFDPAYQTVTLHGIYLHRDGKKIDAFDPAAVRWLRPEEKLSKGLLTGHVTLLLLLNKAELGDVVEYSYTLHGRNPYFDGKFVDRFSMEWETPVQEVYYRLLKSPERKLSWISHDSDLPPSVSSTDNGLEEWTWHRKDVAPVFAAENTPSWFFPHDFVQVSEYASWAEVTKKSLPFYDTSSVPLSSPLKEAVDAIRGTEPDSRSRALQAIRLVQNEIRYLGLEEGTGAFRPAPPNTTFDRRFGDCKDKTVLLARMLHELGIASTSVYVSSGDICREVQWLPSPLVFDHVILRIDFPNSAPVWVDTTTSYQGGPLASFRPGSHTIGLPITGSKSDKPEQIVALSPSLESDQPTVEIFESYRLGDVGKSSSLNSRTVFRGSEANARRMQFQSSHPLRIEQFLVEERRRSFPTLSTSSAPRVEDDFNANEITVGSEFDLNDPWVPDSAGDGYHSVAFFLSNIGDALTIPARSNRSMPLQLNAPQHIHCNLRIELPTEEDWLFDAENHFVEENGLRFERSIQQHGNTLEIDAHFRTLSDAIAADQIPNYLETVGAIDALCHYSIWRLIDDAGPPLDEELPPESDRQAAPRAARSFSIPIALAIGAVLFFGGIVVGGRQRRAK